MGLHDPLRDGQTETGTGGAQQTRTRASVKAFEDLRAVVFGDAYARVRDVDPGILILQAQARRHHAARRGVSPGVVEDDKQELLEAVAIALDDQGLERIDFHPHVWGGWTSLPDGFEQDGIQLYGAELEAGTRLRTSQ